MNCDSDKIDGIDARLQQLEQARCVSDAATTRRRVMRCLYAAGSAAPVTRRWKSLVAASLVIGTVGLASLLISPGVEESTLAQGDDQEQLLVVRVRRVAMLDAAALDALDRSRIGDR